MSKKPKDIVYNQFDKGETNELLYQNGFYKLENTDIFKHSGMATGQVNLGSALQDVEASMFGVSEHYNIAFSVKSNKRWRLWQNGTSVVAMPDNSATVSCIRDVATMNNYIYYLAGEYLGRVHNGAFEDSFVNMRNNHATTLFSLDKILYIGLDSNVASVDDTGFYTPAAIDLPTESGFVVDLINYGDDLLILKENKVFQWDTFSKSWTVSDDIPGKAFTFIKADNYIFVLSNEKTRGTIYQYGNGKLSAIAHFPRFHRRYGTTNFYEINGIQNKQTGMYDGRPVFAVKNKIYSIYRNTAGSQFTICCEFALPEDRYIESIGKVNLNDHLDYLNDFYISATSHNLPTNGITVVDRSWDTYSNAKITTPLAQGDFQTIEVGVYDLPENTSIEIEVKEDNGEWLPQEVVVDMEDTNTVSTEVSAIQHRFLQARITLQGSNEDSPIIDSITFRR